MTEVQWETVGRWCIVAGQAGGNNISLLAIDVDSVVMDNNEFDTWVGHKLDIVLGPQQASMMAALVPGPNTLPVRANVKAFGIRSGPEHDAVHTSGDTPGRGWCPPPGTNNKP
jgi:hypothetical protein